MIIIYKHRLLSITLFICYSNVDSQINWKYIVDVAITWSLREWTVDRGNFESI